MDPIRVGVFDEDEIFRRGAAVCLGDDPLLTVVAESAVPVRESLDVAVVSERNIAACRPEWALVACVPDGTANGIADDDRVMAVLRRHQTTPEQLVNAVRAAAVGLRTVDPRSVAPPVDARTRTVLQMLAAGSGTREISESLGWSERTIKGVIAEVQRELHARTRTQAVAEAVRRELI